MMKKTTLLAGMAFFSLGNLAYAQEARLGINTTTPASTLDISGQRDTNGNLLTTDITGLQAPRLTLTELSAKPSSIYGANQKGALVYITSATPVEITAAAAADNSVQTSNITAEGYYYFDGAMWLGVRPSITAEVDGVIGNEVTDATANGGLIKSGAGTTAAPYTLGLTAGNTAGQVYAWDGTTWLPSNAVNIYNNDGTLAANRTVTQGANTLAFTATSTNAFSVDGTTFSVNALNDRIGLGTAAPSTRLHIDNGTTAGAIRIEDGTQAADKVLTSDASGVATWAATDGVVGNEVTDAANTSLTRTGTGTAADPYKLKVIDGTANNQVLTWDGAKWAGALPSSDWKITGNAGTTAGTNFIGTTDAVDFIAKTNNLERLRIKAAGNVGIGTTAPSGKLDVYGLGNNSGAAFLAGLNGDPTLKFYGMAMGNYTRISAAGPLAFYSVGRDAGTNIPDLILNNGKVGIGTITPSVKLEINNGTTAGAVKIVDGTQGLNKVLTSDADGLATWQGPLTKPKSSYGVRENLADAFLNNTWKYLNWYIEIPANSTYYVNWTFQVDKNGAGGNGWAHILSRLSTTKNSINTTGITLLSNGDSFGTLTTSWGNNVPEYLGQLRGAHVLRNNTSSSIRLYLNATLSDGANAGSPNAYSGYGENAIVAIELMYN